MLICPNCKDNLGEPKKQPKYVICNKCGQRFYNKEGTKIGLKKRRSK